MTHGSGAGVRGWWSRQTMLRVKHSPEKVLISGSVLQ